MWHVGFVVKKHKQCCFFIYSFSLIIQDLYFNKEWGKTFAQQIHVKQFVKQIIHTAPGLSYYHLKTTPLEIQARHHNIVTEQVMLPSLYYQRKAKAALITALPDLKAHRLPKQQVTIQIWNSPSLGTQIRTMNGFPPSWWLALWHFDKRATQTEQVSIYF